ncbi:NADPH-dependent FMN reductase [Streptomyces sp. NPDC049837]|uniref:NADPH-dependent FMN reductase n=1 Tax=Streptomyces sp. NPDC049837 TaxID=3155277 RepID=UPI00343CCEC9
MSGTTTDRDLRILAISGSLRAASHNTALLRAAQKMQQGGLDIEIYDGLRAIPAYDLDLDAPGLWPAPVADLRRRVTEADGLLIATPEFNYGVPGVLKNALDWASTDWAGTGEVPLRGKPTAVLGASPSHFGSVRAQLALRQVLLGTRTDVVTSPEVTVMRSHERFDDNGNLTDEVTADLLRDLLSALADKVRRSVVH